MKAKDWMAGLGAVVVAAFVGALFFYSKEPLRKTSELALSFVDFSVPETENGWRVKPGSVYDGDTLRLVKGHREEKIRLCGIDAPELKQEGGKEARDELRSLLPDNAEVYYVPVERDRYGRMVAEIFMPTSTENLEVHVNSEMVLQGRAWHYQQYSGSCPNRIALETAEELAKENRAGIWQGNPTPPWEWRRSES